MAGGRYRSVRQTSDASRGSHFRQTYETGHRLWSFSSRWNAFQTILWYQSRPSYRLHKYASWVPAPRLCPNCWTVTCYGRDSWCATFLRGSTSNSSTVCPSRRCICNPVSTQNMSLTITVKHRFDSTIVHPYIAFSENDFTVGKSSNAIPELILYNWKRRVSIPLSLGLLRQRTGWIQESMSRSWKSFKEVIAFPFGLVILTRRLVHTRLRRKEAGNNTWTSNWQLGNWTSKQVSMFFTGRWLLHWKQFQICLLWRHRCVDQRQCRNWTILQVGERIGTLACTRLAMPAALELETWWSLCWTFLNKSSDITGTKDSLESSQASRGSCSSLCPSGNATVLL